MKTPRFGIFKEHIMNAVTINDSIPATATDVLPLQPASADIWDKKYRLKEMYGAIVDKDVEATLIRVAARLARVEADQVRARGGDEVEARNRMHDWFPQFHWALRFGAVPAGRILSNAGAETHKPKTSTINCTVSGTIGDSMQDILQKVMEAGLTLKAGCGVGYELSTLRPKGASVSGAGSSTSGPLSFMEIFDRTCATVASAGGRRGAQMGTFDVGHPDVLEFVRAKREDGRFRQFNLSLLITRDFLDAVEADTDWPLAFPVLACERDKVDLNDSTAVVWREWADHDAGYVIREDGLVACRVYKRIKAKALWNIIMTSTYDFAEPGFILIDEVNRLNNNWFCEYIRATNP
ncbi:MAG: hypothetical protein BGO50_14215 [Rhodanobacter sp. 67-28]|nr:MAG: hypothetical protein BGO50_14215 [Rhodanobacter sp. 67-28]